MSTNEEHLKHPSWVLVGLSRRSSSGSYNLFGSRLDNHQHHITLSVRAATLIINRDTGEERYYGSVSGDIIEIDVSAAQFAEFITTSNVGMGVPATMRRFQNKAVESPPKRTNETRQIREAFKTKFATAMKKASEELESAEQLVRDKSGKTFNVKDREELIKKMRNLMREVQSNAPYLFELFEESTEKVVTHAKAEIDAFVTHNIFAEGLRAIKERMESKQLTDGSSEE